MLTQRTFIQNEFTLPVETTEPLRRALARFSNKTVCSVHVRRTDFLDKARFHPVCNFGYYSAAMDKMSILGVDAFAVFSDDLNWCREAFSARKNVAYFCGDQYQDLYTMTLCSTHIIANSSFSWWGAYLANSEYVIAPRHWFGVDGPRNTNYIYVEHWDIL